MNSTVTDEIETLIVAQTLRLLNCRDETFTFGKHRPGGVTNRTLTRVWRKVGLRFTNFCDGRGRQSFNCFVNGQNAVACIRWLQSRGLSYSDIATRINMSPAELKV